MKDYARKSSPIKTTKRSIAKSESDGAWILVVMVLSSILFVSYVAYHFWHEKMLSENETMTTPVQIHSEKKQIAQHKIIKPIEYKKPEKAIEIAKKEIRPEKTKNTKAIKAAKNAEKIKKEKLAALNPADIQPKYDFYKLLPAMKVTIPEQDQLTQTPSSTVTTAKPAASTYVLQMASLQTPQTADQVANALKTAGYKAFVQSYQAPDKSTWYRVIIGPFNALKTAQAEQNKLYAHQMDALLLKVPTKT